MSIYPLDTNLWAALNVGTPSDFQTAVMAVIHPAVEKKIKDFLQYDPCYATRTQYFQLTECKRAVDHLQLRHLPVASITSVEVDDEGYFGKGDYSNSTIETSDYFLEIDEDSGVSGSGALIHKSGTWDLSRGSIKVVYVAGYQEANFAGTSEPDASPIRYAMWLTLAKALQTATANANKTSGVMQGFNPGGLTGERMGDYSYTRDGSVARAATGMITMLPLEAREALQPFKHYGTVDL